MIDISFIIPVYNTPLELLNRCIQSIELIAEFIKIEILIIDDGSYDYIQEYVSKSSNSNILYYRKENGGVSSARNYGIKKARGKYLFFCDADDELIPNTLINKKEYLFKYDLVIFDIERKENKDSYHWRVLKSDFGKISTKDILPELITTNNLNSPCSKLFRKEMIVDNTILFNEKMITAEDLDFVIEFILKKPKILYINECGYVYHREESSRLKRLSKYPDQYLDNINFIYNKLILIINTFSLENNIRNKLDNKRIDGVYNYVSDLMQLKLLTSKRKDIISNLIKATNIKYGGIKYALKYHLLKHKRWLVIYLLSFARKVYLKIK